LKKGIAQKQFLLQAVKMDNGSILLYPKGEVKENRTTQKVQDF